MSRDDEYTITGVSGSAFSSDSTVCIDRTTGSRMPSSTTSGFSSTAVDTASVPNPASPAITKFDCLTAFFRS